MLGGPLGFCGWLRLSQMVQFPGDTHCSISRHSRSPLTSVGWTVKLAIKHGLPMEYNMLQFSPLACTRKRDVPFLNRPAAYVFLCYFTQKSIVIILLVCTKCRSLGWSKRCGRIKKEYSVKAWNAEGCDQILKITGK